MTKFHIILGKFIQNSKLFAIILTLLDRIVSKFANFFLNDPTKVTKWANFKIFRANWGQL